MNLGFDLGRRHMRRTISATDLALRYATSKPFKGIVLASFITQPRPVPRSRISGLGGITAPSLIVWDNGSVAPAALLAYTSLCADKPLCGEQGQMPHHKGQSESNAGLPCVVLLGYACGGRFQRAHFSLRS
jgi:hypothetical protein